MCSFGGFIGIEGWKHPSIAMKWIRLTSTTVVGGTSDGLEVHERAGRVVLHHAFAANTELVIGMLGAVEGDVHHRLSLHVTGSPHAVESDDVVRLAGTISC